MKQVHLRGLPSDAAYPWPRKSPLLTNLDVMRIFGVWREAAGTFVISENCDGVYGAQLTKEELLALADELRAFAVREDLEKALHEADLQE